MRIDIKKNKEEFAELLRSTERNGVEDMLTDLEKYGFFTAPASSCHHLNVAGGLTLHSLNTCKSALILWEGMKTIEPYLEREVDRDSIIIASLLHDICKADIYKKTSRKYKTYLGDWENCEGYKLSFKDFPMGHGEKSLVLALCSGMELSDAEMLAIRWHMGPWGVNMNSYEEQKNYDAAKKLYPLVTIVQMGDGLAANIIERTGESLVNL